MKNPKCQLYKYDADSYFLIKESEEYFSHGGFNEYLVEDAVSWLNFHSIKDKESIERFCNYLHLDKLTIEDIYTEKSRSKLEEYPNYIYFSIRSALPGASDSEGLKQEQISFILGKNYLLSFQQKRSDHFIEVRNRIEKKKGKIRLKGPDFLLFRLLDAIIDNYFEVIESITERIIEIEVKVQELDKNFSYKDIEWEKKKLLELRKIILPLRDMTFQLERCESHLLEHSNKNHFTDLKENCLVLLEEIDANKQILDGVANMYYAVQGQRMNEIMKMLTIVSTIFIPLSFIVGLYGMNFQHMPELNSTYGYPIVLLAMITIAGGLLSYFYKKGWLSNKK